MGAAAGPEQLVASLSLQQKVRLLVGVSAWRTQAEPVIGLREIVLSDGPVGVRGETWDERDTALVLPSPTALAASWDEDLVRRLGGLLAAEARRKGVDVLLAPTLNLHRSPLAGRHFECYSEDPLLTARIGVAYVRGVQDGGVAATAKHYVANDSETQRLTLDARIDARTLREVYLAPFEAAVRAGAWVVMSAYNGVNGATMSEHPMLTEPLKGEWGFDGLVVSDWGAVRSTGPAARAGQDLVMPGPNLLWAQPLLAAVRSGEVPESAIDDKVCRLLRLAARVGALKGAEAVPEPDSPPPARALLRQAVSAGSVLVRNEDSVLPLVPGQIGSVAVIGPHAARARIQGGGSAGVFPAIEVPPLDGIRRALPSARVEYARGTHLDDRPTPVDAANARDPRTGQPGVLVRLLDSDGAELHVEHRLSGRVIEPAVPAAGAPATMEIHAVLRPEITGSWRLAVVGLGRLMLLVDGRVVLDERNELLTDDPTLIHVSPPHREVVVPLVAGHEVTLVARRQVEPDAGRVLGLCADSPRAGAAEELAAAVELARSCEVAVVVVGTTDALESEGFDRVDLTLPGDQDDLVTAVAAANPRTVVVVNTGSPVLMPWRNAVAAVLLGWFPGQEAGDGLADVLTGAVEPGGRLPTTWPADLNSAPTIMPVDGVLDYAEGLHLGYRGHLRAGSAVQFWFGHGLGYTSWRYERLSLPERVPVDDPLAVQVVLRNVGQRAGTEVVQVYLERLDSAHDRPCRWLAGFARAACPAGDAVTVDVELAPRAFQHWDEHAGRWVREPGEFTVQVGRSATDLRLAGRVVAGG